LCGAPATISNTRAKLAETTWPCADPPLQRDADFGIPIKKPNWGLFKHQMVHGRIRCARTGRLASQLGGHGRGMDVAPPARCFIRHLKPHTHPDSALAQVVLQQVSKSYDGRAYAVRDLDLVCAQGQMLALLGPSGCGKSSTLKMIAGIETVTAGRILFDGRDVTAMDSAQRNVAMVFEDYALYGHPSVFENMAFPLRVRGLPDAAVKQAVGQAVGGYVFQTPFSFPMAPRKRHVTRVSRSLEMAELLCAWTAQPKIVFLSSFSGVVCGLSLVTRPLPSVPQTLGRSRLQRPWWLGRLIGHGWPASGRLQRLTTGR